MLGVVPGCLQVSCRAIEDPQPNPILRLDQVESARVGAGSVVAVGVEQLGVVEDTTASPGAGAAVRAVRTHPGEAAARLPRKLHGRGRYGA